MYARTWKMSLCSAHVMIHQAIRVPIHATRLWQLSPSIGTAIQFVDTLLKQECSRKI